MPASIDFQERFKELISETEYETFTELAGQIGISYVIFSKAKNYAIVPRPVILVRIADYFNVSLEYLLGLSDDRYIDRTKNPVTFKMRLEELRGSEKLTYYKLGAVTNIGENYFSDWKKRNFIPSLENLRVLSKYFNVSLDYLLGRTDDK